jgi:glycosyltransferase involved in cell wall biosynthesis
MKIIYITNARIPTEKAHGYQICKMCEEFSNAGAKVELWVPTRDNPIKENAFSFYGLKKNFKINYIKSFDFLKFAKYLGRSSFYLQSLLFFIKLLFKKIDKDAIIYTRNPEIVWPFKLRGFKVNYECHGWFSKKRKKIALFFLKKCGYIITTNNYIKQEFIKNRFDRKKILVAPNGVNMEIFDIDIDKKNAVKKLDLKKEIKNKLLNNKALVYTGSFKAMGTIKGIEEILKASKLLSKDNLVIFIGGTEKDIRNFKSQIKSSKLKNVLVIGYRLHAEIPYWLKAADILILTGTKKSERYRKYTSPMKLFEYMASGRPIIASNLPSFREILNDGNAVLVAPDNSKSLAKGIKKVLKNPDFSAKISKQAHKDVQNYAWDKRAKKILKFVKI